MLAQIDTGKSIDSVAFEQDVYNPRLGQELEHDIRWNAWDQGEGLSEWEYFKRSVKRGKFTNYGAMYREKRRIGKLLLKLIKGRGSSWMKSAIILPEY